MNTTLHIYTRVSSQIQQEEGTSLESQRVSGIKRAAELGVDHRLWNEGGQSSFHDDLLNRPVLVSLLTQIESGLIKHLFVYNTDRLSRNQQTWAVIRYKLLSHGVTLHTASGQLKLNNPVDDLMLGILSEISQYDNKIRSERSRIGRFNKVQQGGWKGGPPPFGYRLVDRRLEIDPFESEWVRAIYNMSCQGKSSKTIQIYLNSHGVLTRRGNRQWSIGSIDVILTNPIYIGYYDYTDKLIGETARIKTPPIVDPWMFEHIKLRRQSHRGVSRSNPTKHFYLLRGLISCGHCERLMGGRINRANHRLSYYCVTSERLWLTKDDASAKWKRGVDCPMSRSINIGKTDQTIIELLQALLRKLGLNHSENNDLLAISYELKDAVNRISEVDLTLNSTNDIDQQTIINLQQSILTTVEKITVSFDRPKNKHQIEVVLGRELGAIVVANGIDHLDLSVGSWVVRTMSARYVDEVASGRAEITERHKDRIRHGRVGQSGRLAQTNGELSAENVILSSDPLVLSLRQRSTYQQELIDTINRLRFDRWNDKQIADHFNHAGKLTPRGHQWVPQSVASIRKKAGRSGS